MGMGSVPEVVTYLIQNTVYREILENLDPSLVHRGNIEKLLILSLYGIIRRSTGSALWIREKSCGCI